MKIKGANVSDMEAKSDVYPVLAKVWAGFAR
jgi:hypothetical protein